MSDHDDEDAQLWAYVTKDVRPIKKSANKVSQKSIEKESVLSNRMLPERTEIQHKKTVIDDVSAKQTDRRTEDRLKRGKIPIEGRIDLHGMRQHEAYDALQNFILQSYAQGKRCVLVITGKGVQRSGNAPLYDQKIGILRQKTPQWLADIPLRTLVLKTVTARPQHGGEGALYVLLRRNRG